MGTETLEWRPLKASTAQRRPCGQCGTVSPWHPVGWVFRYIPTPGGDKHGSKVKTERKCPACAGTSVPVESF